VRAREDHVLLDDDVGARERRRGRRRVAGLAVEDVVSGRAFLAVVADDRRVGRERARASTTASSGSYSTSMSSSASRAE
jgi:hypothetical protein